jgi:hypothetical protein
VRRSLTVLLAAVAAALVVPLAAGSSASAASPASAATTNTMLAVSLTCDATTHTVTAAAHATYNYAPGRNLSIEFRTTSGGYESTTAFGPNPYRAPVSVPATADAHGAWAVSGFTRPWTVEGDLLFYSETVTVIVHDAATQSTIIQSPATCYQDKRTTVTFACDPSADRVDVSTAGIDYGRHATVRVRYYLMKTTTQATPDSPVFVGQPLGTPTPSRDVTLPVAADGTWSDPGIQQTTRYYYYSSSEYRVVVSTPGDFNSDLLGRGEGVCVSSDHS